MVLMPGELRLRHVNTPADVLGILRSLDINIEPTTLQATEVREQQTQSADRARAVDSSTLWASLRGLVQPLCIGGQYMWRAW
jgi:hypothetical protein